MADTKARAMIFRQVTNFSDASTLFTNSTSPTVSVAEGESYMRSLTTEQKAVGKWAGYHTRYPKRRDGCWGSCPGGLCGA